MTELGEETIYKSKHTKNNRFRSRSFRYDRYPCIGDASLPGICAVSYSVIQQPSRTKIKKIKIAKEAINSTKN